MEHAKGNDRQAATRPRTVQSITEKIGTADGDEQSSPEQDVLLDKDEVIQLSDSIFVFPNKKMTPHGNVFEGEIKSEVYGIRDCAIKLSRKSECNIREAKILTKLSSHTHVVSIIQSGFHKDLFDEFVYIALNKCHKQNLSQYIKHRKELGIVYDVNIGLEYTKQIIAGMTYVHESLIFHKDLKPSNILLSLDRSTIKLADFGLSQEIKSTSSKVFCKHQFGTNGFRPPESFGNSWASLKSDIYSLGVVFYFILSNGESPFGNEFHLWIYNTQNNVFDTSHLLGPNPKATEHLIKLMLSPERCRRPSIWRVAEHPCWSGEEIECNFDYGLEEEECDSDVQNLQPANRKSDDSDTEDEKIFQLLLALGNMGFGRYPSKTGNELPDSPLGQVSDSNELLTSNIEKEKINQLSIDYFADLQRLYKSPEKAQEIVKLFKEIHQRVDFNHEHFTVLLQSMEHYEQIGDAQHVDIIADIIEIAYGLLDKARSRILLYDGLKDRLVKDVVAVMNMFKHHAAIQKYGVNIFSLFGPSAILDQIFSVAKVVMQSLDVLHERDSEAKVVEMMTNFPREVSREENAVLGSRANMKNFLRILEQELQSPHKPLLSPIIGALTSLTDETPMSGINLVNENGLDVFDRLLQDKDVSIEVKIDTLMVVSNLAEVSYTQREIIKHRTIVVILQFFLVSRNSRMSFVSANALAHLSDVSETEWTQLSGVNEFRKNTLQKLYEEVQNWESLVAPMNIKFRSFKPLYRLLEKFDSPATQLYAAWTIRYFCLLDEKTYKEILLKDNGFDILTGINGNDLTDSKVRKILRDIILIVQ